MRLLYLSCHSILEYDEIRLFEELGVDVFSHGAYLDPTNTDDPMRPSLPPSSHWLGVSEPDLIELARKYPKENLPASFVDRFDVVMVAHIPDWIRNNWEALKRKEVIWRGIGQSSVDCELKLAPCRAEGMKIVRYSPFERRVPRYLGEDAIIRFYKDPDEFKDWKGDEKQIVNFTQNFKARGPHCNYEEFLRATKDFPRKIFGPGNEDSGELSGGLLSYDNFMQVLRRNRIYFYTGTMPACYTLNFIEAWMTGIPVVAVGPAKGNPFFLPGQFTYEVPALITSGVDGFWSDDIDETRWFLHLLMEDFELARSISSRGRISAIELFGKERIKRDWGVFLGCL